MSDNEKYANVRKGLSFCIGDRDCNEPNGCPYWNAEDIMCIDKLMHDTYDVLMEIERRDGTT